MHPYDLVRDDRSLLEAMQYCVDAYKLERMLPESFSVNADEGRWREFWGYYVQQRDASLEIKWSAVVMVELAVDSMCEVLYECGERDVDDIVECLQTRRDDLLVRWQVGIGLWFIQERGCERQDVLAPTTSEIAFANRLLASGWTVWDPRTDNGRPAA